jgi:hypothetical protein
MTPPEPTAATPAPPRPSRGVARRLFEVISSPRLAIGLLVGVLACCVVGVTALSAERAWTLIFTTLWFNGLLVLLALSSGLTFLARTWGRKLTLIQVGMILFHVSFMSLLGGVVFNSLFHFKGVLRLTEGETLPNGEPASYDTLEGGRFFDFSRLRGETTLVKMHRDYQVDGKNKRVAYEIAVGEGSARTTAIIYVTQNLDHAGVRYLVSKEGYSIGVVLHDAQGRELYAAMVPLQSLPRGEKAFLYTTGSATEPGAFPFPPPPDTAALLLQVSYVPDQQQDRAGTVELATWKAAGPGPGSAAGAGHEKVEGSDEPSATGKVAVGGTLEAGQHLIEAREVRYWVGMTVRHDPGLMVILSSLWAGLGGMTMTFIGRIRQDSRRKTS